MGDQKEYHFANLDNAGSAHQTAKAEAVQAAADLKSAMDALHGGTWDSASASESSRAVHAHYQSVQASVDELTGQRGNAVTQAGQNMAQTEHAVTGLFSS